MSCTTCKMRFSLFTRQYACPRCGLSFCTSCMKHSITLQDKQGSKQKKVCLTCLSKEMAPPQPVASPDKERPKMVTVPGMVEKVRDGNNEEFIKNKLKEMLSAEHVEVLDTSEFGGGGEFAAIIVSSQFDGKSLIARNKSEMFHA